MTDKEPQVTKIWKGQETYEHALFQLAPELCKKNESFSLFRPKIRTEAHKHHFHSHNRKGIPHIYSTPSAGHFHEVTITWKGDKLVSAVCGPALRFKWRVNRRGIPSKHLERIVYKGEESEGVKDIKDDHIHKMKYIRSEVIKKGRRNPEASQALFQGQRSSQEAQDVARAVLQEVKPGSKE